MSSKGRQIIAGLIASFGAFCFGVGLGWTTAAYKGVVHNGELAYHIGDSQFKWITFIYSIGGIVMMFPSAMMCKNVGPKLTMMLCTLFSIMGWGLILFGRGFYYTFAGLFLIGATAGSLFVSCRLYLMEISETKFRGTIGVLFQLSFSFGLTYAFGIGAVVPSFIYYNIASFIPYLIYFFILFCIPESPVFYIYKGRIVHAKNSLLYLRGDTANIVKELEEKINDRERLESRNDGRTSSLFTRKYIKAFALALILQVLYQMSGVECYTFFLTKVFIDSGFNLDAKYVPLLYAAAIIPFVFLSLISVEKAGCQVLLLISGSFLILFSTIFATYLVHLNIAFEMRVYEWIPAVAIVLYNCFFHFGLGSLAFIVCLEMFEDDLRHLALALSSIFNWILRFILLNVFLPIPSGFGLPSTSYIFVFFNIVSIIVFIAYLPETKGKTFAEIQAKFNEENI